MRLELVKRPQRSALFSALSPFIAFVLTMIAGGIMFALLGINPFTAFNTYFISPISEVWQLHELTIKAAPLILIAVGLSVCYRANIWNIGAEGQFILGGIVYPVYRIGARVYMENLRMSALVGSFEMKEHLASFGLALLPAYWYYWRHPLAPEHEMTRKTITLLLALFIWASFLIGYVLNNVRGV